MGKNVMGFSIAEMLQIISMSKKTGILHVEYEDETLECYFVKGRIGDIKGKKERLGSIMLRKDIIQESDLQYAIDLQKTRYRDKTLDEIILEMKIVDEKYYKECTVIKIEETLYEILSLEANSYSFENRDLKETDFLVEPLSIENILMESARRVDELSRMREVIVNENIVFEVVPGAKEKVLAKVKLLPYEKEVLELVNGQNSVRKIIILSGVDDFKVYQAIYAFYLGGVIKKIEKVKTAKKVLVIDDSLTIQKMVELSLADLNYEIYTASDGRTGLIKMKQHEPDIILLDVTLPMMSGYDICKEIKEDKRYKDIPVIMLTARDKTIEQLRGKWMGADYYMGKPFSSEELIQKINDFIQ